MSGPGADERVRRKDYSNSSRIQYASDSGNYLGPSFEQHARGPSVDVHDPDLAGYDEHALMRENSRTALSPSANDAQGFNLPPGAASSATAGPEGYLTPPQAAPTTSGNRVHYPPSPLASRPAFISRPSEGYSSVPLNDTPGGASAVAGTQFTPYSQHSNMGSRANSPLPSGANTPGSGGRRKPWSLFQGGGGKDRDANASSISVENGDVRPIKEKGGPGSDKASRRMRGASWDLLGDGDWEQYNVAKGSVENLRFAEGDVGTNKLSRFYYWAINSSIIVRWALYIVPVLALLWIPGIVGLTAAPYARIWGSPLLYWSIWLTVLWLGFWAATAAFMMVPTIWRATIGSIIPAARKWTDVIRNLGKYAKLIAWMAAVWISFTPVVINHYDGEANSTSRANLTTMANILFGLFLCSIVLGVEKLIIQLIALQFHQDSYEDRVADQKFQIKCLTLLYMNSHDIPGRTDTLTDAQSAKTKGSQIPKMAIRKALRGLREVAQTTTTALGNVASEMAGQSVLQTNSPANRVTAALTSANKSKALARRLFYSFRQAGAAHIQLADIARFFPDLETAEAAFAVFDKDGNGDVTRDELESAVLSLHRDRLSLEASMRDLDGAVRRLDDIFMFIVGLIVILILAAMVTTKLTTLVTSAGTFVLGLSWLIGSTMQEILLSCIFLFVKHPYDVGDRVNVDGQGYTVAKMNLLSTSFKRVDGMYVWIGHNVLTTKVIENIRRSGATSETFVFEVDFGTSFETLQILRAKMLNFCKENARDFLPIFDVIVDDIPAQGKMVLKADIKYKSNWQQGALKVQRRNKWICALKMTLAELKILGPAGAGDPAPAPADPVRYTLVPWEEVNAAAASQPKPESPPPTFHAATAPTLTDRQQVVNDPTQDIWGDDSELAGFKSGAPSRASTPGLMTPATEGPSSGVSTHPTQVRQRTLPNPRRPGEEIEMTSAPVARRPQ